MIGIHYRHHDPVQDWEIVPPLTSSTHAKAFGDGAPVEVFTSFMQAIQNHFTTTTTKTTLINNNINNNKENNITILNSNFFIASNNEMIKKQLLDLFPTSVTIISDNDQSSSRTTLNGIKLAVIEFLLLSKTSLIINTYGSTFAVEAASLGNVPIASIWEGIVIHHSNVFLPFCGHTRFAIRFGDKNDVNGETLYTEGTFDKRQVNFIYTIYFFYYFFFFFASFFFF
jgi:hypothetical protein